MGNPSLLEIGLDVYESCGMADQAMSWISGLEKTAFWDNAMK